MCIAQYGVISSVNSNVFACAMMAAGLYRESNVAVDDAGPSQMDPRTALLSSPSPALQDCSQLCLDLPLEWRERWRLRSEAKQMWASGAGPGR